MSVTMNTKSLGAEPRKRTLFDIGADMDALEQLIESLDGDISDPKVEDYITGWMNELATDQARKVDCYVNLMKKWDGERAAAEAERAQYAMIRDVRIKRVDSLKKRLHEFMERTHQQKITTATGRTVAIHGNGGLMPMEMDETVDPRTLEPRFQRVVINTESVRTALEAGEQLEFASLKKRGTHLSIR